MQAELRAKEDRKEAREIVRAKHKIEKLKKCVRPFIPSFTLTDEDPSGIVAVNVRYEPVCKPAKDGKPKDWRKSVTHQFRLRVTHKGQKTTTTSFEFSYDMLTQTTEEFEKAAKTAAKKAQEFGDRLLTEL